MTLLSTLQRQTRKLFRGDAKRRPFTRRPTYQPAFESLEERILMTVASPPNQLFSTGPQPLDVQIVRLNADPFADTAALNTDGSLTVALNNGNNAYPSVQTTGLGVGPLNGMVFANLGVDAFPDLITQGPNAVYTFHNDGTGQFTLAQTLTPGAPGTLAPAGGGHVQLATGLLNNDPFTDVVTVDPGTSEVLVYLGTSSGLSSTPIRFASGGSQPVAVAVGDFIGDTVPDLAVGHQDGAVTFFQGLGNGQFQARPDLTVSGLGAIQGLASGNFDGSGTELAVSSASGVTILKNNHAQALATPLINGDFTTGLTGWTVSSSSVSAAAGFAQFTEGNHFLSTLQQTFVVPNNPQTLSFDVTSLGLEDPASGVADAFEVSLLGGQNQSLVPTFSPQATSFFNANPGGTISLASGVSFNGTHVTVDISNLTPGTSATLYFDLVGNPPGNGSAAAIDNVQVQSQTIAETFTTTALAGPFGAPSGITAADVDGDGHVDVVVADRGLNQLLVYNGDGAGHFTRSTINLSSYGSGAVAVASGPLTAGDTIADMAVALSNSNRVLSPLGSVVPDTTAPQVTVLDPGPGAVLHTAVTQLRVQFSEAMRDAGPTGTHSVTNPASYALRDTTTNQVVPITAVTYDATTLQAVLTIAAASAPLAAGAYQLTIQGADATHALQDLAGNALGNGVDSTSLFSVGAACPVVEHDAQGNVVTVTMDQNVTIDFSTVVKNANGQVIQGPTYSGDPDLLPFFSYDVSGATADTWKAIFDFGAKKLLIKNGATLTVVNVPNSGNNQKAPGIDIRAAGEVEIEQGGSIVVAPLNQPGGDIVIRADGNITINGTVSNVLSGTNGTPGGITIASHCGGITTGAHSLIQTIGQDHGGSDINLLAEEDIVLNGLVDASYKGESAATISIVSFAGGVSIDGTTLEGTEAGTQRPITSGVTVRSRRDPLAGFINIQAQTDITVTGNRILDKNHLNLGAVAVSPQSTNGSSGSGLIQVVSLGGKIVATDRAFDFAARFDANNAITLRAKLDIQLSVTSSINDGATNNAKAVVSTQGGSAGHGGTNTLRSYSGGISVGTNAQVLANFTGTPGANGTNNLISATGVTILGLVNPADVVTSDNSGVTSPAAPPALFTGFSNFGVTFVGPQMVTHPPFAIGSVVADSIGVAGEVDVWTFTATAGQRVFFDTQVGAATTFRWCLTDPSGGVVFGDRFTDRDTLTLSQAGTYTLTIESPTNQTGAYQFRVWNVPATTPTAINLDQVVSGNLGVPGSVPAYTFTATVGQHLFFDVQNSAAGNLAFTVLGPSSAPVLTASNQNQGNGFVAPTTGTYTVTVQHGATLDATGAFQFVVFDVPANAPQTSGLNTPVSGELTTPGQTVSYTFHANLGQPVGVNVTDNAGGALRFTLKDPASNVLFANQTGSFVLASAPADGTYTLTVSGNADATGSFSFQLVDPTPGTTATMTPVATNSVANPQLSGRNVGTIDFAHLQDITPLGQLVFLHTTFNRATRTLYTDVQVTNAAPVSLGNQIVAVFNPFTPPAAYLANPDTYTPEGRSAIVFGSELGAQGLQPGATSAPIALALANPTEVRFGLNVTLLVPGNQAPVFTSIPVTDAAVGTPYSYQAAVNDTNGDPLSFSLLVAPAGMTVDAQTGLVTWTPTSNQAGTQDVTLQVGDGRGATVVQSYVVTVASTNHAPIFVTTPVNTTVLVGQLFTYTAEALDPDGDTLAYALAAAPAGMTVNASTGQLAWTPTAADVGTVAVIVTASDGHGGTASQSLVLTVSTAAPGAIQGEKFNDLNGNGVRDLAAQEFIFDPAAQFGTTSNPYGPWTYAYETALGQPGTIVLDVYDGNFGGIDDWGGNLAPDTTPAIAYNGTDHVVQSSTVTWQPGDLILHPGINGEYSLLRFTAPVAGSYTVATTWASRDSAPGGTDVHVLLNNVSLFDGAVTTVGAAFTSGSLALNAGDTLDFAVGVGSNGTFFHDATALQATITAVAMVPEPALADWTIYLDANGNGQLDAGETSTVTDAQGNYAFTGLAPGSYRVAEVGQPGWVPTAPGNGAYTLSVDSGATQTAIDFGNQPVGTDPNVAPTFATSAPTTATVGQLLRYDAHATDANGDPLTFDLVNRPAGMVVDAASGTLLWVPAVDQVGTQSALLRVQDGRGGSALQPLSLTVAAGTHGLTITSTPPRVTTVGTAYSYDVTALDANNLAPSFALVTAPAGMTIDPTSGQLTWTPAAADLGTHAVVIQANDAVGAVGYQSYVLTVRAVNNAPAITTTAPTSATVGVTYQYGVRASDADGDAYSFSLLSFPAGMTIDAATGLLRWLPAVGDTGPHAVDVRVTDERGAFSDQTYTLTVTADTQAPSVAILESTNITTPNQAVTFQVVATDNIAVATRTLTINGQTITLDSNGIGTYTPATPGLYALLATATDPSGNVGTATASLRVLDPNDVTPPTVLITSPNQNDTVTYLTPIIGTVTDANLEYYRVEYAQAGSEEWHLITQQTTPVVNGTLATFDPTLLQNNDYVIRVMAQDVDGHQTYSPEVVLHVTGNAKIGNIHLEYTDLQIPLAGIPITITRVYDTLQADQHGDFGFGWTLSIADANIHETVPTQPGGFFGALPFRPGTKVYLTNPEGKRVGFTFDPILQPGVPTPQGLMNPPFGPLYLPYFRPDPGVFDTLTVEAVPLQQTATGFRLYAIGFAYNPDDYTLTTKDGTQYQYNQTTGLQKITDTNQNTLTFSESGIVSSTGVSIAFQRDAQGRITEVIDPAGHAITYTYDASGNLTSVTDQVNNTSTYQYLATPAHYLSKAFDPLGHLSVGSTYDADGRLIGTSDALGNTVGQSYDLTHFTETVTDALGNPTTLVYDVRGNIVSATDPLSHMVTATYDANDNQLSTTDALGHTTTRTVDVRGNTTSITDALGHTSTFTYNTLNKVVLATDALARMTTSLYDAHGNLVEFINAAGVSSFATWDSTGRRTSYTDNNGHTTTYVYGSDPLPTEVIYADGSNRQIEYNGFGQVTRVVDERANAVAFSYDFAGRLLSIRNPEGGEVQYGYDAANHLVSITDPLGRVTQLVYDAAGRHIEQIDALDGTTQFVYNANNQLLSTTDPLGHTTTNNYRADGRLLSIVDALNGVSSFEYDAAGNRTAVIDALGRRQDYGFDALNRVIEQHDCPCGSDLLVYDTVGNLTSVTDKLGNESTFAYDNLNRLVTETDALGGTTTRTYDPAGYLISVTDALGRTTQLSYDSRGRLLSQTDAAGGVTQFQYDLAGNRTAVIDALGHTTQFTFDSMSRVQTITDAAGGVSSFQYDLAGNRIAATDALGRTTQFAFDELNRLIEATDPAGGSVQYQYDAAGQLTVFVDQFGNETHSTYDALGRLTATVDPFGGLNAFGYDAVGNRLTSTDPLGRTTLFAYDHRNRLIETTDANGGTSHFTYDLNDNRLTVTDPLGNTTSYAYDELNRLSEQTDPLGHAATFAYDAVDNQTEVIDRNGRRRTFTFDVLNRQTAETWWDGATQVRTISYGYDAAGNLLAVSDPDSSYTFTYDVLNRQTSVDNVGSPGMPQVILVSTFDAVGNRTQVQDNSGVTVSSTYDTRNLLTSRLWSGGGIDPAREDFGYDARSARTSATRYADLAGTQQIGRSAYVTDTLGRTTHIEHRDALDAVFANYDTYFNAASEVVQEVVNGQASIYGYDPNGQLTSADNTTNPDEGFTYDANGNRVGGGYLIGPNNQILSDGTFNYTYDNEGNRITRTEIATGNVTTYSYDYRNRLTDVVERTSGGVILSASHYVYDALDRRIATTVNSQTVFTIYDGHHAWADYDGAGVVVARYVFGDRTDEILARWRPGQGTSWYLPDRLGSVRDLADDAGLLLNHIEYSSYGLVLSQTNAVAGDRFLFTGREFEPTTGLYYYRARFYDPRLGQFISQDPIGMAADLNLYRYVGNSPVNSIDPSGLLAIVGYNISLSRIGFLLVSSGRVLFHVAIGSADFVATVAASASGPAGVAALGIFSILAAGVGLVVHGPVPLGPDYSGVYGYGFQEHAPAYDVQAEATEDNGLDCDPAVTASGNQYQLRNRKKAQNFILGEMVNGGQVSYIVENLPKDGKGCKGKWMFDQMMQHFGSNVTAIQGNWTYGDNFATVNRLTAAGLSVEEAARQTIAYYYASSWNYVNVTVDYSRLQGSPGKYTRIEVLFTR